jgi:Asp/Glu/hydantoin racemase
MKKIAIIHTTPLTIPQLTGMCKERIHDLNVMNLLDDSILPEINREGRVTESVRYRLYTLVHLASSAKVDAVFCACSSIGGVMDDAQALVDFPVVRVDGPMAQKAVDAAQSIGVIATLQSTVLPTKELLLKKAALAGKQIDIETRVVEEAGALMAANRLDEYDALLARVLTDLLKRNELVVLAQASMARALESMPPQLREKCLTSPQSGVENLARILSGQE